jgi:hypothetical protein
MMHPQFRIDMLRERSRRLGPDAQRSRPPAQRPGRTSTAVGEDVALRLCSVHDDDALERLARLDGKPLRDARFVLAEVDGQLVAAQPLFGGPPLADPFKPTADLLPLLSLRAAQLEQALAESQESVLGRLGRLTLHRGRV